MKTDELLKKFTLTDKELKAAKCLIQAAMDGCGANRPSDFEHDEFTWVEPSDLTKAGYTFHEAAGYWSSLMDKGFIFDADDDGFRIATPAWKWFDTIWDTLETNENGGKTNAL